MKKYLTLALTLSLAIPAIAFGYTPSSMNITGVSLNGTSMTGGNSITVIGGSTISASVTVNLNGKNWHSTSWRIGSSGSYACVDTADENSDGSHTHSFNITAPAFDGLYNVSFIAYEGNNCSGSSSSFLHYDGVNVAANKADQTISFGPLADKVLGDADFAVTATGGASGNPVTFSTASAACTVNSDGSVVHVVSLGSCDIAADQAGDSNYNAAPTVDQTFSINSAPVVQYTLNYTAGAGGSVSGNSSQLVDENTDGSTVTAIADSGYHFVDWSDGYPTAVRTDTNVTADVSATADFTIDAFASTGGSTDGGSSHHHSGSHRHGGSVLGASTVYGETGQTEWNQELLTIANQLLQILKGYKGGTN